MSPNSIVHRLLEVETDYAPEGYTLLDTVQAGDYVLKLWKGEAHVNGQPVNFNEVSLNATGRGFDPASQAQKFSGSIHALGHRQDLLKAIADWIKRYGELYIGSYEPGKLALYHKLFKRHLPRLHISDLYAPFDECEGKPEYFKVTATADVIESILESGDEHVDVDRYIKELPDILSRAVDEARKIYEEKRQAGDVNADNFGEVAESVVDEIVNKFNLTTGDELVDVKNWNTILYHILNL